MTKLYKLTDEQGQSYNKTQWGENISHSGTGQGELCSKGWIHAYTHPLLAVLLNPIHADFRNPLLWEAEGEVGLDDHGLKVGCRTLTTLKQVPVPEVTLEQRVKFGIYCALEVCKDEKFTSWAQDWLSGKDRSREAAAAASWAAEAAAEAAWAAWAAAEAAWEAAEAAEAEAEAAEAAARAAAWAAWAAARAAARAAWAAARVTKIDLVALAEKAIS